MKPRILLAIVIVLAMAAPVSAQLDQLFKGLGIGKRDGLSDARIGPGLKEALGGLFHVLGEEERRIRSDPAARVTDLLKEVFAK